MKRFLCLLAALCMMLSLAACDRDIPAKTEPVESTAPTEPETTAAPTETEPPVTEPAKVEADLDYYFGSLDGDILEHPFSSLSIQVDPAWMVSSQDLLMTSNGFRTEKDFLSQLQKTQTAILVQVITKNNASLSVYLQNGIPTGVTEEEYIDSQLAPTAASMEEVGFQNVTTTKETTSFAGQERICMQLSAAIGDVTILETFVAYRTDEGFFLITATARDAETLGTLLESVMPMSE